MSECLEHLKAMVDLVPADSDCACIFCCRDLSEDGAGHSEGCAYLAARIYLARLNMPVNTSPMRPERPTVEARLDDLELRLGEIISCLGPQDSRRLEAIEKALQSVVEDLVFRRSQPDSRDYVDRD
jgi:hypothetical protein